VTLPEILALLVIVVAAPLNWAVALLLWRLSLAAPRIRALRANAIAALALATIVSVFAAIFVNNGLETPVLGPQETQLVTRGALLILAVVPAAYWLAFYRGRA
jgi:hypothetical protein